MLCSAAPLIRCINLRRVTFRAFEQLLHAAVQVLVWFVPRMFTTSQDFICPGSSVDERSVQTEGRPDAFNVVSRSHIFITPYV